jgi:hypothetical protein
MPSYKLALLLTTMMITTHNTTFVVMDAVCYLRAIVVAIGHGQQQSNTLSASLPLLLFPSWPITYLHPSSLFTVWPASITSASKLHCHVTFQTFFYPFTEKPAFLKAEKTL